jgi:hypothetical protein
VKLLLFDDTIGAFTDLKPYQGNMQPAATGINQISLLPFRFISKID